MESIVKMGVRPDGEDGRREYSAGSLSAEEMHAFLAEDAGPANAAGSGSGRAGGTYGSSAVVSAKREKGRVSTEKSSRAQEREAERALWRSRRKHYGQISVYVVLVIVVSYVLIRLAGNASTVLMSIGKAVNMVGILLQPLFWGFVLAYILSPLVRTCESRLVTTQYFRRKRRGRKKSAHVAAVAAVCVLTALVIVLLLSIVVSAMSRSLKVANLEDIVAMGEEFVVSVKNFRQSLIDRLSAMDISSEDVSSGLSEIGGWIATLTSGLSSGVSGFISNISGFLTNALFAIIFGVYFLLDGKGLARYWKRVLLAVGGKKTRRTFHVLVKDADAVFSGYIRGQLIDALLMAVMISAALSLIGVRYAVIIGVLSGIGNLIPYVGPVIAYASTILVCLVSGDIRRLLIALVVLFLIQTIDGNVINPRLLSSSVDVHPMLVIASLIVGGAFSGLVGMLFAVPVAAFLKIQFDKVIDGLLLARMPEKSGEKRVKRRKNPGKNA